MVQISPYSYLPFGLAVRSVRTKENSRSIVSTSTALLLHVLVRFKNSSVASSGNSLQAPGYYCHYIPVPYSCLISSSDIPTRYR